MGNHTQWTMKLLALLMLAGLSMAQWSMDMEFDLDLKKRQIAMREIELVHKNGQEWELELVDDVEDADGESEFEKQFDEIHEEDDEHEFFRRRHHEGPVERHHVPRRPVAILLVTMLILVIIMLLIILLALVTTQSLSCTRVTPTVCMPSSDPVMLTSMLMVIVIMVTIIWATGSVAVTVLLLLIIMWGMETSMTSGRTIPMGMARCWTTLLKLATSYPLATRSLAQGSHTSTAMTTATSPSPRSPMPSTRELRSTDFDVCILCNFIL